MLPLNIIRQLFVPSHQTLSPLLILLIENFMNVAKALDKIHHMINHSIVLPHQALVLRSVLSVSK
ncbi:hypothetical protein GcC1_175032 [Golovinomyces cichoracearum]|uniref:Uncharacterized protein n=1 Tax=Golovinomyces cichoracearum TaxID=62708 RepID=A0A420HPP5_9PEZI|nr:hypothetical protein GcC1_175032 [Golovinomyces cichoracearum]